MNPTEQPEAAPRPKDIGDVPRAEENRPSKDKKLAEWLVTVPIAGYATIIITADSKKAAIKSALRDHGFPIENPKNSGDWELGELETYEHIFQGNISHIDVSEADAEEVGGGMMGHE